jgi:hypothetical protein
VNVSRKVSFAACLLLASCAITSIPTYSPPPEGAPYSMIKNQGTPGVTTTSCQFSSAHRVCRASLLLVDKQRVSFNASENRVEAGARRLRISCAIWRGGPFIFGNMTSIAKDLAVELKPGVTYSVRGMDSDDTCGLTLVEDASGVAVGTELPFGSAGPSSRVSSD